MKCFFSYEENQNFSDFLSLILGLPIWELKGCKDQDKNKKKNPKKFPIPKEHSTYFTWKLEIKDNRSLSIFCKLNPLVLFQSIAFFASSNQEEGNCTLKNATIYNLKAKRVLFKSGFHFRVFCRPTKDSVIF